MTFSEWFQREYPLYERVGGDTSLKAALRIAWQTAEHSCMNGMEGAMIRAFDAGISAASGWSDPWKTPEVNNARDEFIAAIKRT